MWITWLKSGLEFSTKAASAALFGILLLIAFALTASMGSQEYFGFFRYDYLLFYALIIQVCLLYLKLESWAEAKVIALFHILAMIMEIFLTHPQIASWQYPQPAVFKIMTVPLFAGFMYSAVGSFFARSLRLYRVSLLNLPTFSNMLGFGSVVLYQLHEQVFYPRYSLWLICLECRNFLENQNSVSITAASITTANVTYIVAFGLYYLGCRKH